MYERKLLGSIDTSTEQYKKAFERMLILSSNKEEDIHEQQLSKQQDAPPYLEKERALDLIREYYKDHGIDPTNPDAEAQPFLSELRLAVIEHLDLQTEEQMDTIKIYTTVSSSGHKAKTLTPADYHWGTDAFIDIHDRYGVAKTVTIDIAKDKKSHGSNADVLVDDRLPDPITNSDQFLHKIDQVAGVIVEKLQ